MLSVKFPHVIWLIWENGTFENANVETILLQLFEEERIFFKKLMCLCCFPVGGGDKSYVTSGQKADCFFSSSKQIVYF